MVYIVHHLEIRHTRLILLRQKFPKAWNSFTRNMLKIEILFYILRANITQMVLVIHGKIIELVRTLNHIGLNVSNVQNQV